MSQAFEITGTILLIHETQTFASGFSKREFVITTDDKYPQEIKLEVVKDLCESLEQYNIGDEVDVSFNIRGNEYNGKHYVNLQAWKINRAGVQQSQHSTRQSRPAQQAQPARAAAMPPPPAADAYDDECDDIPF